MNGNEFLGYYRVMYEDNNWERLTEMLQSENFENIHILNRVQLIDDSLEFARTLRIVCLMLVINE